jgi:hypothetical protein
MSKKFWAKRELLCITRRNTLRIFNDFANCNIATKTMLADSTYFHQTPKDTWTCFLKLSCLATLLLAQRLPVLSLGRFVFYQPGGEAS